MIWPLVTGVGFFLAVGVVIALARGRTARWEQEQERELGDEARRPSGQGSGRPP